MGGKHLLAGVVLVIGLVSYLFTGHFESDWPFAQFDDYFLGIVILAGINLVSAVSLNLVNGYTGQFSLGHAGFLAVGAYVSSFVCHWLGVDSGNGGWWVFPVGIFCAGVGAGLAGFLVGMPSLRLRGDYLAIVTLGFGEIIRVVIQNMDFLGGARGISGIKTYTTFGWVWGIAVVTIYVISSIVNSTYGRGFIAVRDDEIAAGAMGVNPTRYKVTAFVIGAFFAGVSGSLYAHFIGYINPEGFNFLKSVDVVVMVILGGMGSTFGVAVSAVLLTFLNELLRSAEQYRMIVFALLLIVIMIVRPQGLIGGIGWLKRYRPGK